MPRPPKTQRHLDRAAALVDALAADRDALRSHLEAERYADAMTTAVRVADEAGELRRLMAACRTEIVNQGIASGQLLDAATYQAQRHAAEAAASRARA